MESGTLELHTAILANGEMGKLGRPATWDRMVSGVANHRGDGPNLSDWVGDGDRHDDERISISTHPPSAECEWGCVMETTPRDVHEPSEIDNSNVAITSPNASDVPAARLGNFRCGGSVIGYHAPNISLSQSAIGGK